MAESGTFIELARLSSMSESQFLFFATAETLWPSFVTLNPQENNSSDIRRVITAFLNIADLVCAHRLQLTEELLGYKLSFDLAELLFSSTKLPKLTIMINGENVKSGYLIVNKFPD
jgi:hypothetical protein